ncbi:MAG: hypothetical protein WAW87_03850 [Candidatus Ferrigenium altingense]
MKLMQIKRFIKFFRIGLSQPLSFILRRPHHRVKQNKKNGRANHTVKAARTQGGREVGGKGGHSQSFGTGMRFAFMRLITSDD